MRLRSTDAYWEPGSNVPDLLKRDLRTLRPDEVVELVTELDRRFMQLWDKVAFEQKHGLVDYTKLKETK